MANLTDNCNIKAHCKNCKCNSGFIPYADETGNGRLSIISNKKQQIEIEYRLYRCLTCGCGALASIRVFRSRFNGAIETRVLEDFYPETATTLALPQNVPVHIQKEFEEAETCASSKCYRAAAALLRSTLDKTLIENGYTDKGTGLKAKIDIAAREGLITAPQQKAAQANIKTLGDDVLHDEYREIKPEEIEFAKKYCQRILEAFYDDRDTTLAKLVEVGRIGEKTPAAPIR